MLILKYMRNVESSHPEIPAHAEELQVLYTKTVMTTQEIGKQEKIPDINTQGLAATLFDGEVLDRAPFSYTVDLSGHAINAIVPLAANTLTIQPADTLQMTYFEAYYEKDNKGQATLQPARCMYDLQRDSSGEAYMTLTVFRDESDDAVAEGSLFRSVKIDELMENYRLFIERDECAALCEIIVNVDSIRLHAYLQP